MEYVFFYLLITIIIGLFLYVRNGVDKLDFEKKKKEKVLLKKYSELFLILKSIPKSKLMTDLSRNKKNKINRIVSAIIPYLTESKMQYFLTWEEKNKEEILNKLKKKIRILKINQNYNMIQEKEKFSIFSIIKNGLYTTGIKNIILTFIYMIFIIVGLLLTVSIILKYIDEGISGTFILISQYLFWFFVLDLIFKITNYRLISKEWKLGNNWWKLYLIIIPFGLVYIIDLLIGFKFIYVIGFIIYAILALNISNIVEYLNDE